ncbi:hypothetical protein IF1G_06631 [Cordyceps javanica]|uniref:Uncharacterized protein n=1 Tax=Cordyceps javanica TaxID=43265 RepID=A0A545UYQ8_9HYPO|nr:hypothetical protein IF1G_06631 [Cordyceps javanica]TQW06494.1 hypothetical protein IF2G_05916 [Cordyceps javanica]
MALVPHLREGPDGIFYLHTIDEETGAVRVQILRSHLEKTFRHHYAQENSNNRKDLPNITSGFLAVVTASSRPIILAWAESGHGLGRYGDALDADEHLLGNARWAAKAREMAGVLGISLSTHADGASAASGPKGSLQAGHVEVKLATYAAVLLLKLSAQIGSMPVAGTALTRENLSALRRVRWSSGGGGLHFEVHVSRKNCHRCGAFLRRLERLTGVRFDIRWGQRLVPIQYPRQDSAGAPRSAQDGDAAGTAPMIVASSSAPSPPPTREEDGIIFYLPPDQQQHDKPKPAQARAPPLVSPHHLSRVDKPLPATPVTEPPDLSSLEKDHLEEDDGASSSHPSDENAPFPLRSPRPYGMCLR